MSRRAAVEEDFKNLPAELLDALDAEIRAEIDARALKAPADIFPWHRIQAWILESPNLVDGPVRIINIVGGNRSGKTKVLMGIWSQLLRHTSPLSRQLMTTDRYTGEIRQKDARDPLTTWIVPPTLEKARQDWINPSDRMGLKYWAGDLYVKTEKSPDLMILTKTPGLEYTDRAGSMDVTALTKTIMKCIPLDEPIQMADGTTRALGAVGLSDMVVGVNRELCGSPVHVVGVHRSGLRRVYRITMVDGSSARFSEEHVLPVEVPGAAGRVIREMCVSDILGRFLNAKTPTRLLRPRTVTYVPSSLPLHPYAVGALIGDGHLSEKGVTFSQHPQDAAVIEKMRECLSPIGYWVHKMPSANQGYYIGHKESRAGQGRQQAGVLVRELRALGLMGTRSHDKFVPDVYKGGSVRDRMELLAGLVDTDGDSNGGYCTASRRLANDIADMVRSLGGWSSVSPYQIPNNDNWYYHVRVNVPSLPVALPRKLRTGGKKRPNVLSIRNMEYVGELECGDITVDNDTHWFVCGSVVCHNSQDQDLYTFESSEVDAVFVDEEFQEREKFTSCLMRVATTNGVIVMGFTPLLGLTWTHDRWWKPLVKQGRAECLEDRCYIYRPPSGKGSVVVLAQMGSADNPRAAAYSEEIRNDPGMTDAEKNSRLLGEYGFVEGALVPALAGLDLMSPRKEHEPYVIDVLPGDKDPATKAKALGTLVQYYLIADPNKSMGAILGAVDEDDNIYLITEHLQESWPNRKHAEAFQKMEKIYAAGQNVLRFADPGSAGAQSMIDFADFGLHFSAIDKGAGSVSASLKKLRNLAYLDPDHAHPITGKTPAPRIYFYRPGMLRQYKTDGVTVVACRTAEQLSQARQSSNLSAPPDTPHKSVRSKLDLFDCVRYFAALAEAYKTGDDDSDEHKKKRPADVLPPDDERAEGVQSKGHPLDQHFYMPSYEY